jgi:hypothetical protein
MKQVDAQSYTFFILCFSGRGSEAANTGHFSVEDLMEAKIAQLAPNPWLTRQVEDFRTKRLKTRILLLN